MGSSAADRARLEEIEVEVLKLQRSIGILRAEEKQVKKRLNSRYYPVLTLPNELVSEIFLYFLPEYPRCPPMCGGLSPITLTQICRSWREIAISTPRLWRAISFNYGGDNAHVQTEVVKIWLERSGRCALSIETDEHYECNDEFVEAILPHRMRWEYITVEFVAGRAASPRMDGPMHLLRQLEIHISSHDTPSYLSFHDAPMLTTATLWDFTYPPDLLPWTQLTSLTLIAKSPFECTAVLECAVNLLYCELTIFADSMQHPDITLVHLESLVLNHFQVDDDPAENYILSFTVPALRRLQIPEKHLGSDPIGTLASFVSISGCRLQELHITGARMVSTSGYRMALPFIPRVSFNSRLTHWYCREADHIRAHGTRSLADFESE
ncbi:hypothetical protein B0H16DRAFT_719691 [Mycena metata]|uniref:F-box domain-containing protein n=1 Tax=Mycena metata TaxID=1033252 RepID=A0AAD7GSA4_9AGAR|nr:hypothetical protein B0H16DRAFT_719691 [Mycena metata]